jgi:uncharacterized protein YukE
MKRLSKTQQARHEEISQKLATTRDELNEAIQAFNAEVTALHARLLQPKVAEVNVAVSLANAFVEEIHGEQESYFDERSDTWREGDAGSEYENWKNEWELSLDELELEDPAPFDEVDMTDADEFENLQQEVST